MTKKQFLSELKLKISSLPKEEQDEALQYYSDFFDDCDDDKKAIEELGSVDDVAFKINEKFANALVKAKKDNNESDDAENGSKFTSVSDALVYTFDKAKVKNMDIDFAAIEVVAIPGKKFIIETRGLLEENIDCYVNDNGTLVIRNVGRFSNLKFWSHDRTSRIVPRILLTIPQGASLDKIRINLGAGKFETKNIDLSCNYGSFNVSAGNLVLKEVNLQKSQLRCGMGNLDLAGTITGECDIDCGMGNVNIKGHGKKEDYSYDAKIGLGNFIFNEEKKSGVSASNSTGKKQNHFSVNVGMGQVNIKID